ncbi:GntR family transcriptional regulator [Alloyangia pacifica]|uniref:DNA-binding transcriptional regulator, GntR family n=1 Tax=Alloyangia pacifica TaxID=311180 RepID=A0A1I6UYQ2_9RHOB|nr:GntR family transcriptional regulator [Alloyangia pacifica]SDI30991.1 DNA-binding transcriptional regulator, GntR family [Alloyangia pacifica]SFT06543.1 DNA-binding transcriptional regulator, GntR family [Alloyangia pacifica]
MDRILARAADTAPSNDGKRKQMSLTRTVYLRLRDEILTCKLAPGLEISEAELAQQFDVSKTPVREALAQLRQEGLVRTFPRRGYQISPITFGDMNELFDLRTILEAGAAELACEQITDDMLVELRELAVVAYEKEETQTIANFIAANRRFHMAIAAASGNSRLVNILARQIDELERFFYIGAQMRDVNSETNTDHLEIVDALARRDRKAARDLMIRHNDLTRQGLFQSLAMSRQAGTISL